MYQLVSKSGRPFRPDGRIPMPVEVRPKYESQWLANKHATTILKVLGIVVRAVRI